MGATMPPENAPLRTQRLVSDGAPPAGGRRHSPSLTEGAERQTLGRVRTPDPGPSVRVTVRLGLVPNSLAFWRRRRHGTASAFAHALSEATGLRITSAYVRYWETAVGIPPGLVIEATSLLLDVPPTLIWTQEQLRSA